VSKTATRNNQIEKSRTPFFAKKAVVAVLAAFILLSPLFSLPARANPENWDGMIDVYMKVNRKVHRLPDLYERLTLTVKTSEVDDKNSAEEVLRIRMNLLDNKAVPIGKVRDGGVLYAYFEIVFDGPEATNDYQNSMISTSYDFYSGSPVPLTIFKIMSWDGEAFGNMTNLNPGDVFEGKVEIDPGTERDPQTTVPEETTTGGGLPPTSDETPLGPVAVISAILGTLLVVQIVLFARSKRNGKTQR
jgi:hypothetical protein